MNPWFAALLSWLALPVYLIVGARTRLKSLRLSPAPGELEGMFGDEEPDIRLLVVGDSSAAGVGLESSEDLIGAQLARKLHQRTGRSVFWRTSGHNSATAGEIRDFVLPHLAPEFYTHILIMIGVNDLKNFHSARRWKKEFGTLIYALRTRFPEARLIWHQAIDLERVPALPPVLGKILNWRRAVINAIGNKLCVERGVNAIAPLPIVDQDGFCRDGFHANALGYDYWSDHLLDHFGEIDVSLERTEPQPSPARLH